MKIFELVPNATDKNKSYYKKAHVIIEDDGTIALKSYNTIVAKIKDNKLVKLWRGYSATTMRHINTFLNLYGFASMNKREWLSGENVARYQIEFSNGFVTWRAGTIFDDYDDAEQYAEHVASERNYNLYYYIYEV